MLQISLPGRREVLTFSVGEGTAVGKILADKGLQGFEPETLAACCAIIETEAVSDFADIGANIGIFSLVLGRLFPNLGIKAFEPLPWLNETATALCLENDVTADVRSEALSRENGQATFYVSAQSDSSNSLSPTFRRNKDEIEVSMITLDDLSKREAFTPRLIKVDTESTEPDVLDGGRNFIQKSRPWIICEVLAGRTEERLNAFVKDCDYVAYSLNGSVFNKQDTISGDTTYQYRDWLFAPEEVSGPLVENYAKWVALFDDLD